MEVANASEGGTLVCIPSDALSDDKRGLSRVKKRHKISISSTAEDSGKPVGNYANATRQNNNCPTPKSSMEVDDWQTSADCFRQSWSFDMVASFSCCWHQNNPPPPSSDVISTIDYQEAGQLIATGGLARKIRICSYPQLITKWGQRIERMFTTISIPAKLSSLKWSPAAGSSQSGVIACGDYDGCVTEWDVEYGATVSERYEHTGRTVWSIDYSAGSDLQQPLLASASSDSTVRFWSRDVNTSVGIIKSATGNAMCCVEFSRFNPRYLAIGSADARIYLYDTRKLNAAFLSFKGHDRSVSYIRWLGHSTLVSSSPDGTIKLWDICSTSSSLRQGFDSHLNTKNFVGLAVTSLSSQNSHPGVRYGELIASGSENNEMFVYSTCKKAPVFRHKFPAAEDSKAFVGSVCWTRRQADHLSLISANSEGIVQVIQARPLLQSKKS